MKCLDCDVVAPGRRRLCDTHLAEHTAARRRRSDASRPGSHVRRAARRARQLGAIIACEICARPFGTGHMTSPRYDHNHATGQFRGWLCHQCNVALGLMGDDPSRLRAAAAYVETRP